MKILVIVLVIVGALFAIASGIWVAIALVNVISKRRATFASEPHVEQDKTGVSG